MARLPPAPPRFTTTIGCPRAGATLAAIQRATMSGGPPAMPVTIRLMGLFGYCRSVAADSVAATEVQRAISTKLRLMARSSHGPAQTFMGRVPREDGKLFLGI